jgi:biofilm PGA synthesis protein PgaD
MSRARRRWQDSRWLSGVVVTSVFWALWLYLVMPLLSLLAWMLGIHLFTSTMLTPGGIATARSDLQGYGIAALAILAGLGLWVLWNRGRYGGRKEMRTRQPLPCSDAELAEFAGISQDRLHAMQDRRQVVITFDARESPVIVGDRGGQQNSA